MISDQSERSTTRSPLSLMNARGGSGLRRKRGPWGMAGLHSFRVRRESQSPQFAADWQSFVPAVSRSPVASDVLAEDGRQHWRKILLCSRTLRLSLSRARRGIRKAHFAGLRRACGASRKICRAWGIQSATSLWRNSLRMQAIACKRIERLARGLTTPTAMHSSATSTTRSAASRQRDCP